MRWTPLPRRFRDRAANSSRCVLLETSRPAPASRSYLFTAPLYVMEPQTPEELRSTLRTMDEETASGRYVAGYIAYEAGFALEPRLERLHAPGQRLAWIGVYPSVETFDHSTTPTEEPATSTGPIARQPPQLSESLTSYTEKVGRIKDWIAAGETYQANLTLEASWSDHGTGDLQVYAAAMAAQPVEYGAWLRLGDAEDIVSASPELFFRRDGSQIRTRPMKGTAPRGYTHAEDLQNAAWLAQDEKNRAENLMIVDLLRNDLGRLCQMGSVRVDRLFAVETFPTLLQMSSDIHGTLRPGIGTSDIFHALFPSGSIVGAPKIRTMQLLHTLEHRTRGIYTGAIGWQGPGHQTAWNVAIRTIHTRHGRSTMGVGSGILWDSDPAAEFAECRTKTAFLERTAESFQLIETMLWHHGYQRLERHLERLAASANYFSIPLDHHAVHQALQTAARHVSKGRHRVRLTVRQNGTVNVTATELAATPPAPHRLLLVPQRTSSKDLYLRHKTTKRTPYDTALAHARDLGCLDALFRNENDALTECAIHNLFLTLDGRTVTPPLPCGVLPGILRAELLREGRATEQPIHLDDLTRAQAIFVTNSVRGIVPIDEVVIEQEEKLHRLWSLEPNRKL